MRGHSDDQLPLFHLFSVEDRIRPDHPLRDIKRRVDRLLAAMSPQFAKAYSTTGRPSVPPERLLKALLLMALYSVRSERQLCERIDTDLLFRWFLDPSCPKSNSAWCSTTRPVGVRCFRRQVLYRSICMTAELDRVVGPRRCPPGGDALASASISCRVPRAADLVPLLALPRWWR